MEPDSEDSDTGSEFSQFERQSNGVESALQKYMVPNPETSEEANPLADLKDFFTDQEKLGKDLPALTASTVTTALRATYLPKKAKELADQILRPGNCPGLKFPRLTEKSGIASKNTQKRGTLSYKRLRRCCTRELYP